jgi:glyoxylase-like metal-dependent hydrolase (beta-lactamase superfamily II)
MASVHAAAFAGGGSGEGTNVSEPKEIAERVDEVVDGVWHWRIHNAAIGGGISSSHAVLDGEGGCVLVDPVRLAADALAELPHPDAVALTARTHQRSAWRYRRELGVEVWLPEDAPAADEEPDRRYDDGDRIAGGLIAIRTPGPEWPHYCFLLERDGGVLFCSDLVSHDGEGRLEYIPFEYHDDPEQTKRSVERLLELPFAVICFDHGPPLTDDPKGAIGELIRRTP